MDSYITYHGTFHSFGMALKFDREGQGTWEAKLSNEGASSWREIHYAVVIVLGNCCPYAVYLQNISCPSLHGSDFRNSMSPNVNDKDVDSYRNRRCRRIFFFWRPKSTVQKKTVNIKAIPFCSTIFARNRPVLLWWTCGNQPVPVLDFYGYTCDR